MARITFEPPANRADWERACNYFHVPGHPYYSPNTLDSPFAPCDLTIDPTRPETWARAVYEAGVRRGKPLGAAEHLALFGTGMPPPAKGYGKSYTETLLGGVTQQPAKTPFEPKTCYVCGKARRSAFDGWCMSDGRWVCHSACADAPRQPLPSIIINGTEYRPVTPS